MVDSCLLKSELGTSHIAGQQSRQTAAKFTTELVKQLSEQGVQVTTQVTPFICGYMPAEQVKKYDFKVNPDAKRQTISQYPILNTDNSTLSPPQATALLNFNQSINALVVKNTKNLAQKKPLSTQLELSDTDQANLIDQLKTPYVFIVSTAGVDVSFGRSFVTGAVSLSLSMATLGAGASVYPFLMPAEGQTYSLNLVDLNNKQVLWSTGGLLNKKVFSEKKHSVEAPAILNPLFEVNAK